VHTEKTRIGWGFWLRWTIATTVGLFVGLAIGGLIFIVAFGPVFVSGWYGTPIDFYGTPISGGLGAVLCFGGPVVGSLVVGALIGSFQWLVLRKHAIHRWVLATIGGVGAAELVVAGLSVFRFAVSPELAFLFIMVPFPALIGVMQWLVLRRLVSNAGWWVPANIVGFIVAICVPLALVLTGVMEGPDTGLLVSILGLPLYGATTGGVLVRLLRQPVPAESGPQQAAA
jgi:hypothetical protein